MKVGLVGWACRTGLGVTNSALARRASWVTQWLVPRHGKNGVDPGMVPPGKGRFCERVGDEAAYRAFVEDVDVVLFVERPYVREFDLAGYARSRGRLVCAIPNVEWIDPEAPWLDATDLMWAPTAWSAAELRTLAEDRAKEERETPWADAILEGGWGTDLEHFRFRERTRCDGFLFLNGHNGANDRKGLDAVRQAASLAPETRIRVFSQTAELPPMPGNVDVRVTELSDPADLYEHGDVLLAPSRWEGFGNTLYEAQACGLPVITTDAAPMNECGGRLVEVERAPWHELYRPVLRHEVRPAALAEAMRAVWGSDIRAESQEARERVEARNDLRPILGNLERAIRDRLGGLDSFDHTRKAS